MRREIAQAAAILATVMRTTLFLALPVVLCAQERGALNEHLPSWLNFGVQSRIRAEGNRADNFGLFRLRLSADVRPLRWLEFFGEAQDARSMGFLHPDASVKDTLDVRQAYVRLGSEDQWWDLKVGRQKITFGTERVIGAAEWGNTARVFDAVRLGIHHGPNRVDLFSSSVVNNDPDNRDHHKQGNNLHGVVGSLGSLLAGARIEPYLLLRDDHRGNSHSWTAGTRVAGAAREVWSYEVEALRQTGAAGSLKLSAWASTVQVQRKLAGLWWNPSLLGEFNYASGDRNPQDLRVNTFDQLYPTNHGFYGIADQVGRRNSRNIRGGVWWRPEKRLTVKTEMHSFWLASRFDGLYAFNGVLSVPAVASGAVSTDVGRELDVIADVKLSSHYDIGAQYGHLFPGDFLRTYSDGAGRGFYAVFLDFRM